MTGNEPVTRSGSQSRKADYPSGVNRLPIVGVMGSGTRSFSARAVPLGCWLARRGVHLLTGGGGGVMSTVCESFCGVAGRAGSAIGILPYDEATGGPPPGYPNSWVEIAIYTHLPARGREGAHARSRNHINILSADVIVALPGAGGTSAEVMLAMRYDRPVVAFVDSRKDIPELSDDVPIARDLIEVQGFVDTVLGELNG